MFGLGTWEMVIILAAALIFIGPNKLPEVAKTLGKGVRSMRRAMNTLENEVQAATRVPDRPAKGDDPSAPRDDPYAPREQERPADDGEPAADVPEDAPAEATVERETTRRPVRPVVLTEVAADDDGG